MRELQRSRETLEIIRATVAAVMVCECCGGWTVELVAVDVPPYGKRWRYRVKTPFAVTYVAHPAAAEAILRRGGVLDRMRETG
jgi:hypothetical protein